MIFGQPLSGGPLSTAPAVLGAGGADVNVDCSIGALVLAGLAATILSATNVNCGAATLALNGLAASITNAPNVSILVRAPYLTSDTLGTKTYDVYDIQAGVLTLVYSGRTTGFTAIPNITNGWWANVGVAINGAFGDFAGIAVFNNINGSGKAAVELYSPPTSLPSSLVIDKIAPFLAGDTITTPGYQLYTAAGATSGGHVTSGILAISGITNGYVTKLALTPDANNGAQFSILWDGG